MVGIIIIYWIFAPVYKCCCPGLVMTRQLVRGPSSPPQMGASVDTRAVNEISHSPFLALEEIWLAKAKIKILQAAVND